LEGREEIQRKRRRVWEYYWQHLQALAGENAQGNNVRLPVVPAECEQAYHMFYLILPSLECRQALIAHLKQQGILSVFHYVPLHLSAMGMRFGARECPVTEDLSSRLLRLPFYNDLTEDDQAHIVGAIEEFFGRN
jgi:dTDP-4-amino-4,6-dideoxygalactose transaminase